MNPAPKILLLLCNVALVLAHFLEHLLFLGTERYPLADEYQSYLREHGGFHNAFTALEHTNYDFDVDPNSLRPALDRFAPFFISPKFSAQNVERERNAVHSESRNPHFQRDRHKHIELELQSTWWNVAYSQIVNYLPTLLVQPSWTEAEKLATLQAVA